MDWWQNKTKLKLEKAVYQRMIIRDVNNYIAIYDDGSLKTKGVVTSYSFSSIILSPLLVFLPVQYNSPDSNLNQPD
jgi:hypothetical protein